MHAKSSFLHPEKCVHCRIVSDRTIRREGNSSMPEVVREVIVGTLFYGSIFAWVAYELWRFATKAHLRRIYYGTPRRDPSLYRHNRRIALARDGHRCQRC